MDLGTTYLGIGLRTPLVPSASPLSEDLDKIRQMEQAGASAVVLHSLFEEQTEADAAAKAEFRVGPKAYLEHIRRAKSAVKIPIIGSLNCTTLGGWISYTRQITEAGADALELNIYRIPTQPNVTGSTIEETYIDTVRTVRAATKIPLAVKLSPYFSNFANVAQRFDALGADGLVLFNRFYQPDIDLEKMEVTPNLTLSVPADMRLALHWIGILYGKIRANLAATSGIYQAYEVIKMILAGADVTMLCSALMRYGIANIQKIEMETAAWLEDHRCSSLSEIKGRMSQKNCPDPSAFERAQYVRGLSSYTSLFPMRR
ncbi:MAG: dihydroorotate dehydrogenase-like protein [Verrucomicrobia bacterium]|nr:MAG: dihydroorotate dehydrogenase-like protein [Verrucomicrobiota bacterium]PYK34755.1 MAG: dihydroorotate dehydrogenase-like protein [Verrucomicrobiota bacterium]PYL21621.1 MAG: dihydroorotate dehydrogenase-like protein [Verrucomicrobiota bacterium]